MAKFISDGGIQFPALERVGLTNASDKTIINPSIEGSPYYEQEVEPGQPYIFEGYDRDAVKILNDMDMWPEPGFMGEHFTNSNDMFALARQKGYKNVKDYVKSEIAFDAEKAKAMAEIEKKKFFSSKAPDRVKPVIVSGGGTNTTPGGTGSKSGGMGPAPE